MGYVDLSSRFTRMRSLILRESVMLMDCEDQYYLDQAARTGIWQGPGGVTPRATTSADGAAWGMSIRLRLGRIIDADLA